jgi:folate-binding protein YgfZ
MAFDSLNPIHHLHELSDAEFQNYCDIEIASTFGEPQAEYAAIRKGCALLDLPQCGLLEVRGKDRIDFLNRFLTNELIDKEACQSLAAGQGRYAFLLNNKGRIVADMNLIERGEYTLLETDARNIANIKSILEKYIFSEKVSFTNLLGQMHQIALHGPRGLDILRLFAPEFRELAPLGSEGVEVFGRKVTVWRDDPCGVPGYYLAVPTEAAEEVWKEIIARTGSADPTGTQHAKRMVWPTGWAVFNTTRIEAGRPLFGIDFDDTVLPAETSQLERAVSFTKGCYLGQEIVARMHARKQVPRQIVGVRMEGDALPLAGAPIVDDRQNQIGGVTSSTLSPVLSNVAICLAMVKRHYAAVGTKLTVAAEGAFRPGVVAELPFVKSS